MRADHLKFQTQSDIIDISDRFLRSGPETPVSLPKRQRAFLVWYLDIKSVSLNKQDIPAAGLSAEDAPYTFERECSCGFITCYLI